MPKTESTLLNQIPTTWALVKHAHQCEDTLAVKSRQALLDRYCGAAWRYLRAIAKDESLAEELFQEFALRLLRGDFRRAEPVKGRFRDYLKTVLVNLMRDDHRQRNTRPHMLVGDVAQVGENEDERLDPFVASWREELLDRTWTELRTRHQMLYAVLKEHVQGPSVTSQEKANRLSEQLSSPFTSNRFRVALHRARDKFRDLLVREVEHSLDKPTVEELQRELTQLNLQRYCDVSQSPGGSFKATGDSRSGR